MSMEPGPRHLIHACVVCTDFDRSLGFYVDVLGAETVETPFDLKVGQSLATFLDFEGDSKCKVVFLRWGSDTTFIELQQYYAPGQPVRRTTKDIGLARIAFLVDDIDATARILREDHGIPINGPVDITLPSGLHRKAFSVRDPDGNLIELIQYLELSPAS
jgi:catechol 2,3-dioxygenase-like lactoylglutathione lyase family enzyme